MNDYERYDFWHRETVQVKIKDDKRTMSKLIESNKKFDPKTLTKPKKTNTKKSPSP